MFAVISRMWTEYCAMAIGGRIALVLAIGARYERVVCALSQTSWNILFCEVSTVERYWAYAQDAYFSDKYHDPGYYAHMSEYTSESNLSVFDEKGIV